MDDTLLAEQLQQSLQRNEVLLKELASLRAALDPVLQSQQALRRDYEALVEATRTLSQEREALKQRAAELEAMNHRLVDMLWGRRSERRSESPDQQHLDFGDGPAAPPSAEEQVVIAAQEQADEEQDQELLKRLKARREARRAKQQQQGREEFPPGIERRERIIDLPEDEKEGLKLIAVKESQRLRFEKPHVYVEVIKRPQYAVPGKPEEGVRSMPPPLAIVESCKYDFSVIAAVLAMKFAFHLPTYREQDWFAQCGWFPSRSTVNDLINYGVATVDPLCRQMWSLLLSQSILLGDDTHLRVLLRGAVDDEQSAKLENRRRSRAATACDATGPPGSATSYAWLYTGLDGMAPFNVFHWSLTHENCVIDEHLAGYRGVFVGDACGANARLEQRSGGRIVHAACNAHARREFVKAESNDPVLASQALSFYRQLYEVEERGKPLDNAARGELRQRDALPIWNRMRLWLDSEPVRRALPQSAIGGALGYLRNHWSALMVYLTDPRIPFDNDQSERAIRPLTVGRVNWLFLAHPCAAPGRMQMFSIVSSAHRHHLVIADYLEDVLYKLADAQQNHPSHLELGAPYLLDLLPDRWAQAHPESIRQDRAEEREIVSDAKRSKRAKKRIAARAAQPTDCK
ncbi:MAG: IS66 family transposase [Polyangia bacterium]